MSHTLCLIYMLVGSWRKASSYQLILPDIVDSTLPCPYYKDGCKMAPWVLSILYSNLCTLSKRGSATIFGDKLLWSVSSSSATTFWSWTNLTTKDCHQTEIKFLHVGHEGYRRHNVTSVPILNLLPYIEDDARNLPLSFNTLDWSVFLALAAHPYLGQLHKHLVLGISFSNPQCF